MYNKFWLGLSYWLVDDDNTINTIMTLGPAVQYYILTENAKFTRVLSWLGMHDIAYSVHLNRTRFVLDTQSRQHTEFMLLYSDVVGAVDPSADLVTGTII